jgi:hypothetical protein
MGRILQSLTGTLISGVVLLAILVIAANLITG